MLASLALSALMAFTPSPPSPTQHPDAPCYRTDPHLFIVATNCDTGLDRKPWTSADQVVLDAAYRDLLCRSVDPTGQAYWQAHVEAGWITVHDVAEFIKLSPEYQAR